MKFSLLFVIATFPALLFAKAKVVCVQFPEPLINSQTTPSYPPEQLLNQKIQILEREGYDTFSVPSIVARDSGLISAMCVTASSRAK